MQFSIPSVTPVTGVVNFEFDGAGLPGVACIEYFQNRKPLSGKLSPPYDFLYDSRLENDGPNRFKAVAYDENGNVVTENEVRAVINNTGGTITSTVNNIDVGDQVLAGTVDWTAYTTCPTDPNYGLQAFLFYVDGKEVPPITSFPVPFTRYARSLAYSLNTTQLTNGTHELSVSALYAWIAGTPDYGKPYFIRLQATTSTEVDNGHVTCQLRPRWRELRLYPGNSVNLDLALTYTDGVGNEPVLTIDVTSDRPDVATCDSSGQVIANGVGTARLTIAANDQSVDVFVKVKDFVGLPHFGWDGRSLTIYDPHYSTFVRSMFSLGSGVTRTNPDIIPKMWAANINTIEEGFYPNPYDNSSLTTYALWEAYFDALWSQSQDGSTSGGFSMLLTGDGISRTWWELNNTLTGPYSTQAVQHAFSKATASEAVIGVEMVDEVNMIWGDTPTPTDGRWLPIPDDGFVTLISIIDGVPNRPKITWPVLSGSPPQTIANWTGNPSFSGYSSHYWSMFEGIGLYSASVSLPQLCYSGFYSTCELAAESVPTSFARIMEVTICGPAYTKYVEGTQFSYGDLLQSTLSRNTLPMQVSAQIMYAAGAGMAGVRLYSFDSGVWKNRRMSPIGTPNLQTGSDPDSIGTDRWNAMGVTFGLVKELEPYLLQEPISPVDLGPMVYTAARQTPAARLFMATNMSEVPTLLQPDLTPYTYTTTETYTVERRRILSNPIRIVEDTVPDTGLDSLTLQSGESVVWIFTPPPPPPPYVPPTLVQRGNLFGWNEGRTIGDFAGLHV